METIIKINIIKMKEDIKSKVELQKFYKLQRKTNIPNSDRNITAKEAQYKHLCNREDLRVMYAAYGLARGKSFSQTENHYPEENHPLQKFQGTIDRILEKYKILVEVETHNVE
jgi:hypothetical protein